MKKVTWYEYEVKEGSTLTEMDGDQTNFESVWGACGCEGKKGHAFLSCWAARAALLALKLNYVP